MNTVYIEFSEKFVQAAKLSGDRLSAYFAVATDSNVGDIFIGRVENVRGGQCFVNYDTAMHNGILEIRNKTLKSGDYVMCQVVREQSGEKGAVLSDRLSIAGSIAVISGAVDGYKFSRRLTEDERLRLKVSLPATEAGFILRKQAAEARTEEIVSEMTALSNLYKEVAGTYITNKIRRIYHVESQNRVLQEIEAYGCKVVSNKQLAISGDVTYYEGNVPLFDYFMVRRLIGNIFSDKVELKNGVELVFNRTEAMTVIDVNSKSVFGGNIDSANESAAEEIMRQIRLRNLSGLILVDFISTQNTDGLEQLVRRLAEDDKEQCSVYAIRELSIIAINRKKRYNEFTRFFYEKCPLCQGTGKIEIR
ncbi:MAG: ribonuclease E/G [Clostridia bacterium]|nr:ribonuclease E/G [Clostridia bacterium]